MHWLLWLALGGTGLVGVSLAALWKRPVGKIAKVVTFDPVAGRKLGLLERWYEAHNPRSRLVTSMSRLVGPPLSIDNIMQALGHVCRNHPALRCKLDSKSLRFLPVSNFEERIVVEVYSASEVSWEELATRFQNSSYEGDDKLMWKLAVVTSPQMQELLFCCNHLIVDGIALATVTAQILDAICAVATDSPLPSIAHDAFPAMDGVVDMRPTVGKICTELIRDRVPASLKSKPEYFLGPPQLPCGTERHSAFLPFSLDAASTALLVAAAKAHNTTVHAACCAAAFFAASEVAVKALPAVLRCDCPVSMHGSLPSTNMGVYLTATHIEETVRPSTLFWDLAKRSKTAVVNETEMRLREMGLLGYLSGSWRDFLQRQVAVCPNARASSIEVSNMGRQDAFRAQYGPWSLKNVYVSMRADNRGSCFSLCLMTVLGEMSGSVAFVDNLFPAEMVQSLIDAFLRNLRVAASSKDDEELTAAKCVVLPR